MFCFIVHWSDSPVVTKQQRLSQTSVNVCVQSYHLGEVCELWADVHRSRLHPVWAVHPGPGGPVHPTNSAGTTRQVYPCRLRKHCLHLHLFLAHPRNFMAPIPNAHQIMVASSTSVISTESRVWWRVTPLWWEDRVTPRSATLVGNPQKCGGED